MLSVWISVRPLRQSPTISFCLNGRDGLDGWKDCSVHEELVGQSHPESSGQLPPMSRWSSVTSGASQGSVRGRCCQIPSPVTQTLDPGCFQQMIPSSCGVSHQGVWLTHLREELEELLRAHPKSWKCSSHSPWSPGHGRSSSL